MDASGSATPASAHLERLVRWGVPIALFALHAVTARGYGVFRDELYYIACGLHLDWGYVDHPPMVALVAALVRQVAGTSWLALRLVSALAAGATVLLVGDTARRLGGGAWARVLAQLLAACAPIYLAMFSIYSMNGLDLLVWAGLARLAADLLDGGAPRRWLLFGALAGLGLQTKIDVGLLGAGVAAGLVLARRGDLLRQRRLWLGGGIAVLIFLPHLLWQAAHGWPTREFIANAQGGKIVVLSPLELLASQLMLVGPVAALLALAGLGWLLLAERARPFRALGWAAVVVLTILAASVSKPYYVSPIYTLLFPAAGVLVESATRGRLTHVLRPVAALLAASVLVAAPLAKPLLPVDAYLRYAAALGQAPSSDENHRLGRLPQYFADMHGWHELAQAVARVHRALPAEDQAKACFFGQNYGQAGAVEVLGPELGLPPAVSGHNSYFSWGPGACTGEVLIVLGGDAADLARNFESFEPAGRFDCTDCMPYEDDQVIWVARGLRVPIAEAWPGVKHFD